MAGLDAGAMGVQVEVTRRQFGEFRNPPDDRELGYWMLAQVFQDSTDEVAHVEQFDARIQLFGDLFRRRSGAGGCVRRAGCDGDVDAAVDRCDPRRARVGHDDTGGAEDTQPSEHTDARVPGLLGDARTVVDRDGYAHVGRDPDALGCGGDVGGDVFAGFRVDGRLPHRQRQSRQGDGTDAFTAREAHATTGFARFNDHPHDCAMGDVGVVAGVLRDRRHRMPGLQPPLG